MTGSTYTAVLAGVINVCGTVVAAAAIIYAATWLVWWFLRPKARLFSGYAADLKKEQFLSSDSCRTFGIGSVAVAVARRKVDS